MDQGVPAFIAWTLPLALDGTVAVTTPIWLSTVEEKSERNYAAFICTGALIGSMAVNAAGHGWVGILCPLISYFLIHLVGRVLRAGARRHALADTPAAVAETPVTPELDVVVPDPTPPLVPRPSPLPEPAPLVPEPEPVVTEPEVEETPAPAHLTVLPRRFSSAADMARDLLDSSSGEMGGAEITRKVRDAGFSVGDNYGRSMKARWVAAQREEVAV